MGFVVFFWIQVPCVRSCIADRAELKTSEMKELNIITNSNLASHIRSGVLAIGAVLVAWNNNDDSIQTCKIRPLCGSSGFTENLRNDFAFSKQGKAKRGEMLVLATLLPF